MTAVIEWIGSGLMKILDMFKNPELVKPEDRKSTRLNSSHT